LGANELAIHQLAFYDPLTNLPNRRLLRDRLQRALSFSKRDRQFGAVLMIDLDNFKSINDTLGHDIGDLFLKEIALRLQSCLRQSDTVARLGGDEFIVMLANLSQHERQAALQAQEIGEKILKSMALPVMLGDQLQHRSPSIGACLFRGDELSIEELFKRADISMYQAKNNGRNNLLFYDPKIQNSLNQRNELEVQLHTALTEKQLRLYYQIQVDHIHGAIGAEVLLRWQHPIHGLVYPDQFIAIAEESSLIVQIGHWVLQTACAQLRSWAAHPATEKLSLSVNVSARQFRQADFVEEVGRIVTQTGVNPQRLKLELTESLVLHNVADTTDKMNKLNGIGIQFSMDDFGTGYSSLAHLSSLPIQELKIDRSFVEHIPSKKRDTAIVQAIIGLAENLGIAVIAEGVETEEQRLCLERFGCQSYQGYLFGKAMPIEQFEKIYLPETGAVTTPPGELVLTI
jgi:diguanylate cyclase (GGDEF)-like protein